MCASLSAENSIVQQKPSSIFEVERRGSFEERTLVLVRSLDDAETVRLWLLQKSPHTKRAYVRITDELSDFLKSIDRSFETARPEDLINFCSVKLSWSSATVMQRAAVIKSVFSYSVKLGRIKHNPAVLLKFKRTSDKISEKNLTEDEALRMLELPDNLKDRALL